MAALDEVSYNDWANQFKSKLSNLNQWTRLAGATAGNLYALCMTKYSMVVLDRRSTTPDNNQAERSLRLAVTKQKLVVAQGQ